MPENFTILPGFAQEGVGKAAGPAGSVVLDGLGDVNDYMLKAQALGHEMDKYNRVEAEKAMKARADEMAALDLSKVRPVDLEPLAKEMNDYAEWVKQNPTAYTDPKLNAEREARYNRLSTKTSQSKALNAYLQQKMDFTRQSKGYATPQNLDAIQKAYAAPMDGWKDVDLQAPNLWNPAVSVAEKATKLKDILYNTRKNSVSLPSGQTLDTTTHTTNAEAFNAALGMMTDGEEGEQSLYSYEQFQRGLQAKMAAGAATGNEPMPVYSINPKTGQLDVTQVPAKSLTYQDYVNSRTAPALYKEMYKDKELKGSNYQAAANWRRGANEEMGQWLNRYVGDLQDGKLPADKLTLEDGTPAGTAYPAPPDWTEKVTVIVDDEPKQVEKRIVKIVEKNGRYYKLYEDQLTKDGKFKTTDAVNPENEITDFDVQFKIPYANQNKSQEKNDPLYNPDVVDLTDLFK